MTAKSPVPAPQTTPLEAPELIDIGGDLFIATPWIMVHDAGTDRLPEPDDDRPL